MSPLSSTDSTGSGAGEIMLFGVRVVVDSMRKSVSMNNLSQYELRSNESNSIDHSISLKDDVVTGYASADDVVAVHQSKGCRERKRGVPWTEDEHKLFLIGLQKVGKGDWRGISRIYVKTRTPTQVASHAQKYFIRRSNQNRRRRRSSLFDITTDTVSAIPMEEEQIHGDQDTPETCNNSAIRMVPKFRLTKVKPPSTENQIETLTPGQLDQANNGWMKHGNPIPDLPVPDTSTVSNLSLGLSSTIDPLRLSLSLSFPSNERDSSSRYSTFQGMSSFNNGDSIISVA